MKFGLLVERLKRLKGPLAAIAAGGAILSGLVGYYTTYKTVAGVAASGPASASAPRAPSGANPLSLIVLPFANQTGDVDKAYIADGLTSSITADLSRIREMLVLATSTAFSYKDKTLPLAQIGQEAGVRFVLQGQVLASADKLRIRVSLADTHSGTMLWTDTLDGEVGHLFALQDQVTSRVGGSIGREMVIAAARDSEKMQGSAKAADWVLRARALVTQPPSLKNWQAVQALYRKALSIEPDNLNALLGLAEALNASSVSFGSQLAEADKQRYREETRRLALRAKELDPEHPEVYRSLAEYEFQAGSFAGFKQNVEAFHRLAPNSLIALQELALLHDAACEPNKTIEVAQRMMAMDPKHPAWGNGFMSSAYLQLGEYEASVEWSRKVQQWSPTFPDAYFTEAIAQFLKGDKAAAQRARAELHRVDPNFTLGQFIPMKPDTPQAYKDYWSGKLLPAARELGIPE